MASEPARVVAPMHELERGRACFVVRPRVGGQPGVQRFFLLLSPEHGQTARRVAVGKKRLPRKAARERGHLIVAVFNPLRSTWAVSAKPVGADLRRGQRDSGETGASLPPDATAARRQTAAPRPWARDPMVANDVDDGDEMPFSEPSIFDDELQAKFGGRRFAPLEPAHLDVEGAELVLVDANDDPADGTGV